MIDEKDLEIGRFSTLPDELKTDEVIQRALAKNPNAIGFIPVEKITPAMVAAAFRRDYTVLHLIPDSFITEELAIAGLSMDPANMAPAIPDHMFTEKVCLALLAYGAEKIRDIPRDKQTNNVALEVAKNSTLWFLLKNVREDLLTDEVLAHACLRPNQSIFQPMDKILRGMRYAYSNGMLQPISSEEPIEDLLSMAIDAGLPSDARWAVYARLAEQDPGEIAKHIKTEPQIKLFREIFGTRLALRLPCSTDNAKRWLSEDMGL